MNNAYCEVETTKVSISFIFRAVLNSSDLSIDHLSQYLPYSGSEMTNNLIFTDYLRLAEHILVQNDKKDIIGEKQTFRLSLLLLFLFLGALLLPKNHHISRIWHKIATDSIDLAQNSKQENNTNESPWIDDYLCGTENCPVMTKPFWLSSISFESLLASIGSKQCSTTPYDKYLGHQSLGIMI